MKFKPGGVTGTGVSTFKGIDSLSGVSAFSITSLVQIAPIDSTFKLGVSASVFTL